MPHLKKQKQPEQVGLHLPHREMGSGNNTDCTAFLYTHAAQMGEKCDAEHQKK